MARYMRQETVVCKFSTRFSFQALRKHGWSRVLALVLLTLSRPASATEHSVLVLYGYSDRSLDDAQSLKSKVRASVSQPVNFYVEYLDCQRFDNAGYEKAVFETLRHTYRGRKLDLVMPESYPALQFALRHRDELFPDVPMVFFDVYAGRIRGQKMWPDVTGVTEKVDIRGTIDLALGLIPGTDTVAIITNNSEFERYWLAEVHTELVRHRSVREVDLVALPPSRLLERVAALPPHTVILFQEVPQESMQPEMGTYEVLTWVGQHLPTFCIFPMFCLNHGAIGGVDIVYEEQISLAAQVAGRVLAGERPESIPLVNGSGQQVRVDWRQLRYWNIPESALPAGTQILYREPTLWQRVQKYAVAAITVIIVQSLLIFGLLTQRARKRKAEAALRENERRFRGRLLEAQEEERQRIARELHDDISQKLALLSTELVQANRDVSESPKVTKKCLEEIQQHCLDIAHDVHSLSHQLHSSKLDYLGVVPAIRGLCNEVCKQCDVSIEFKHENVPTRLPENVSVCLFRVAQEALHNAVKYSGMRQFEVAVRARANEVELVVSDAGNGFDVKEATTNRGLGLVSMQERVHLIRGRFSVESRPGSGTRIVAAAPLSGSDQGTSANADGHRPLTVQ
jgi:signal transduction histidine kinase